MDNFLKDMLSFSLQDKFFDLCAQAGENMSPALFIHVFMDFEENRVGYITLKILIKPAVFN